jgi:hypothetical protein
MQRIIILLTFTYVLSISIFAQVVPNGGFESWTLGFPDNWFTTNVPLAYSNITQSSTAHSGSSSARGDVISYLGNIIPPVLTSGTTAGGFVITQRYATFSGYYQFTPVSGDQLSATCILYKGANPIATAISVLDAASSWTLVNSNFIYVTSDVPDKAIIAATIVNTNSGTGHPGSFFLLDDLNLSGTATSVDNEKMIPAEFSLEQNFPNPFNPSTKIVYNLPENSFVSLKIFNAIGMEVATLVNSVTPAGSHEILFDAQGYNSGVYFYTLKTGNNFVQTKKMILMK